MSKSSIANMDSKPAVTSNPPMIVPRDMKLIAFQ